MSEARYQIGDTFRTQFVWKIPDGDYIRAIFEAEVLARDRLSDKYVARLTGFVAGRQESDKGELRAAEQRSPEYWPLVLQLAGRKISLAYEADDGRPLWLRLETLTGEHNFFRRLSEMPPKFSDGEPGPNLPDS